MSDDESDAAPPERTRLLERMSDRCVSLNDERRIRAFDDGDEAPAAIAEGVPSEANLRGRVPGVGVVGKVDGTLTAGTGVELS